MFSILLSGNLYAQSISCREAVIKGQKLLGNILSSSDFSSRTFADYNLSSDDFNELSSHEQSEIYEQIKPLEVMVEQTIHELRQTLSYYQNSIYALYMIDEINDMLYAQTQLKSCLRQDKSQD